MPLPIVKARLHEGVTHLGWTAYWIVDEEGRQLNTEPVCLVPEGFHDWFKQYLKEMEFDHWGLPDQTTGKSAEEEDA